MPEWHVGQEVYHGDTFGPDRITTVSRVMASFIECADGSKWTIGGRPWGSSRDPWAKGYLRPLDARTKQVIQAANRCLDAWAEFKRLSEKAGKLLADDSADKLERVVAAMREALGEGERDG